MASSIDNNLLTNATVTATASASFQNLQNALDPYVELLVHVANAPTGTSPTLTFSVAVSNDNVNFDTPASFTFTAITAAGWQRNVFSLPSALGPIPEPYIKVTWTIGGSASPTFTGVTADVLFSNPNEG